MKKINLVLAVLGIACVAIISSCSKVENSAGTVITDDFEMIYTEEGAFPANAQQIFDFAPVGHRIPAFSGVFASNVDAELSAYGTSRDKVISVKGESMIVSMQNNPSQNFDFMDSVWVYVSKLDGSNELLFGSLFNYPLGLRALDLVMTNTDVKSVFNADSVKLSLHGTKRTGTHTLQANTQVEFKAKVEGIFDITP